MTESNSLDEDKTTETLHDVFDVIVEASQDPEHHRAFEQLRQTVQTEFQRSRDRAIGIVNLAFSDEVNAASHAETMAMFDRVERGETTFEEEDARLMIQWRALKGNSNLKK